MATIKETLHGPGCGADTVSCFEIVENIGQADKCPVPDRAPANERLLYEQKRFALIDDDGRWSTFLMACHDERFRLALVEIEGTAHRADEIANLGHARLLNAEPSFRNPKLHLTDEPPDLSLLDPGANHHLRFDMLEDIDRIYPAKGNKRGRVADKRHLGD